MKNTDVSSNLVQTKNQNQIGAPPESRESKLVTLLDLMEKSSEIKNLPAERVRLIKEKYLRATDESIDAGIKMLLDNQEKKMSENIELKQQLQEDGQKEKLAAEKAALNILKQLENNCQNPQKSQKKSHLFRNLIVLFFIGCTFMAIVFFATNKPKITPSTTYQPVFKTTTPASSKSGAFQKAPSSIPHRSPPVKSAPFVK